MLFLKLCGTRLVVFFLPYAAVNEIILMSAIL